MSTQFHIIIPARFASTRLPGKMLLPMAGKPLIQRTYEQAKQSGAQSVVIATDDVRIKQVAEKFGAEVYLTSKKHTSGTTRIAEVARKLKFKANDIIVNVQGDEPQIPPANIRQVAQNLAKNNLAALATLCEPLQEVAELFDPNIVKVACDKHGYALTFSRAPILWERENFSANKKPTQLQFAHFRHIGIYAYRSGFLQKYPQLKSCELELGEKLEQLRAMWHGYKIHVALAKQKNPIGIDTEEDFRRACASFG